MVRALCARAHGLLAAAAAEGDAAAVLTRLVAGKLGFDPAMAADSEAMAALAAAADAAFAGTWEALLG